MRLAYQVTIAVLGATMFAFQPALAEVVCDGQSESTNGYDNRPIGSSNEYMVQLNYWNSAVNDPPGPSTGDLCLDINTDTGAFSITTAPGDAPTNGGPTSYPSVFKGCHWGELCTSGSIMPLLVTDITGLPSTWNITAADGVWDAAYDIWFNTTPSSGSVGQNDGLEIMVWINNEGYPDTIEPSGGDARLTDVTVPGVEGTWDVWTARLSGEADWNVVSFVKKNKVTAYNFDGKKFIDFIRNNASTLKCPASASDQTNPTAACIGDSWYLTSVQAGFEPWRGGLGLASGEFKVDVMNSATVSQDGRTGEDGTPIVFWGAPFEIVAPSCPGGSATYTITNVDDASVAVAGDGTVLSGMPMSLVDNKFVATVPTLDPNTHDLVTITVDKSCGSESFNVYVDPSGNVLTLDGQPIPGATVTLLRSTTADGVFEPVLSGSTILAPYTATNPQTSDVYGHFGWDVDLSQPAYYKVRAEMAGCGDAVESDVYNVPPPVMGIVLQLDCQSTPDPSGNVQIFTDWGTGYCANIIVTNTTPNPLDWNTTVTFPGGNIYTAWNFNRTLSGNQMTIWGVDWNKTLQPGASTYAVGFCANR